MIKFFVGANGEKIFVRAIGDKIMCMSCWSSNYVQKLLVIKLCVGAIGDKILCWNNW